MKYITGFILLLSVLMTTACGPKFLVESGDTADTMAETNKDIITGEQAREILKGIADTVQLDINIMNKSMDEIKSDFMEIEEWTYQVLNIGYVISAEAHSAILQKLQKYYAINLAEGLLNSFYKKESGDQYTLLEQDKIGRLSLVTKDIEVRTEKEDENLVITISGAFEEAMEEQKLDIQVKQTFTLSPVNNDDGTFVISNFKVESEQ